MKEQTLNRILLIEDNAGDVRLTEEALKEMNLSVHLDSVDDGMTALDFLRRQGKWKEALRPDLILLDLNLPRKKGQELLAEIKIDSNLRRIPIVIMTSSKAPQEIGLCYDLQASCCIQKPVQFEEFLKLVKEICHFWFQVVTLPSR